MKDGLKQHSVLSLAWRLETELSAQSVTGAGRCSGGWTYQDTSKYYTVWNSVTKWEVACWILLVVMDRLLLLLYFNWEIFLPRCLLPRVPGRQQKWFGISFLQWALKALISELEIWGQDMLFNENLWVRKKGVCLGVWRCLSDSPTFKDVLPYPEKLEQVFENPRKQSTFNTKKQCTFIQACQRDEGFLADTLCSFSFAGLSRSCTLVCRLPTAAGVS